MTTQYHSTYYAHELTKRNSSDDLAKLGASLFNATVDLNPHQLDAARYAFNSPLSSGAILADEVGLGKFELLAEKFNLFDGVFGSSDDVLGALESGVDFERRIAEIYQKRSSRFAGE